MRSYDYALIRVVRGGRQAQVAHLAGGHCLVPQHHLLRLQDHFLVHQLSRTGQEGL